MVSKISAVAELVALMVKEGKPQSTIQMREHLATKTYYGASASTIRHIMLDNPGIFVKTGKTTKVSTMGCAYEVDTYYLAPSYFTGGHAAPSDDDIMIGLPREIPKEVPHAARRRGPKGRAD